MFCDTGWMIDCLCGRYDALRNIQSMFATELAIEARLDLHGPVRGANTRSRCSMVAERKAIDIEGAPVLEELTRELARNPAGLELRRAGQVIATIMPEREGGLDRMRTAIPVFGVDGSPLPDRRMTPEQVEQLLVAVHELAPFIDADQMHRNVEESRQFSIAEQRRRWALDDSE